MEFGICNTCNKKRLIVNKKHNLCNICNKQRLNKDKDKTNNNSQVALFIEIWNNSDKKCQLTGENLSWIKPFTSYWFSCFAHILPKGRYPHIKYNIKNILLVHPEVHHHLDHGTDDSRLKRIGQGGVDKWERLKSEMLGVYE